ncbi:unnamed protein product [Paramecium pentaurelia]|uniref:tyrosine--tRNA ligase n=1 Tax=Paramecium pentaurelia TaxID=43138 RepID=A0A8S1XFD4_9CILI|nr:unnamed protein product [Paramecium pentaurelia]
MFATIDPLTGGLIWEVEGQKDKEQKEKNKVKYVEIKDVNIQFNPRPSRLSLEEKLKLLEPIGEELINKDELINLLKTKTFPICYDGFEPSGRMHIAQGLLRALNVNRLVDAGCIFIFWVADWFALLNNKMGGDLNKIKNVGRYFIEVWKAAGMKMHNVKFLWASDEINKRPNDYWLRVLDLARKFNVSRIKRCGQIMGRNDDEQDDKMAVAQLFYPCMQCNDIFFLEADICQLGMDQRKVNMLAREYADKASDAYKPIIMSHHMMMGLLEGQVKMSKSDLNSAIFMEDSAEDVKKKIKNAYCPPQVIKDNPVLDYTKEIIFGWRNKLLIQRKPENGGDKEYTSYAELEADFISGALHPGDLKPAVTLVLNELIQPVRDHFTKDPEARALLQEIRSYQVTK